MDKYKIIFNEYEGKWENKAEESKLMYTKRFYDYILDEYGYNELEAQKSKLGDAVIENVICNFSIYKDEVQQWFKENIMNNLNKENIILSFMQYLNNELVNNNANNIKELMKSFISTGLIKNIEFINNMFVITTLNAKKIKFGKLLKTKEEIDIFAGKCHGICYEFIKRNENISSEMQSVTILEKNLYGYTRYHSFLVWNNTVYDFARNILISYENYKDLFNNEIINCIRGDELLKVIKQLETADKEFKANNGYRVLKLALHKQINEN